MSGMPVITIRNLPEETQRALKVRAAQHGRSIQTEGREILKDAVRNGAPLKIGSALAAFGRRLGGLDLDAIRDPAAARPATFE